MFICCGIHFVRECPKRRGEGGDGTGVTCFNCGYRGHRAAQCPSSVAAIDQDEAEEEDITVDGILAVSEVTTEGPSIAVEFSQDMNLIEFY